MKAEVAVDPDRAGVARLVAGDEAQQRRLADAVGADERHPVAVADVERDVVEQGRPTGAAPGEVADGDGAHGAANARGRRRPCGRIWPATIVQPGEVPESG